MPELPEVETIVQDLKARLQGATILALEIFDERLTQTEKLLIEPNTRLVDVGRRGKYILFWLEHGVLIQHLRMSGLILPENSPRLSANLLKTYIAKKQIRYQLKTTLGNYYFFDQRRFGTLELTDNPETYFASKQLAPEIDFNHDDLATTGQHFVKSAKAAKQPIKAVLLDQAKIAGVGNIYADEGLHKAGVHPATIANKLRSKQLENVYLQVKDVMAAAIAKRGTSMSDYLDVNGNPGVFQKYLFVYQRTGLRCKTCKTANIERIKITGRSTHFCPSCQK